MRLTRLIVAVLAGLLAGAPAATAAPAPQPQPQPRIVGGGPTTQAWPAQASVRHLIANTTTNCGGTLVSARWVLTAGHCVTRNGALVAPAAFSLRIGSTSRETGGFESTVDAVLRNPSFVDASPPNYDVALLHLVQTAPMDPLRLIGATPADGPLWSPGTQATIIGWGRTGPSAPQSPTLLEARVPIVADATCQDPAVWGGRFDPASMVCAGGDAIDTCPGDSGGPLMVPRLGGFAVAGVVSWGDERCGTPGAPGVYTRVGAPAIDGWIRSVVPTIAFTTSPAVPLSGAPVTINAAPGPAGGTANVSWDTDGDGVFDNAFGPSVTRVFPAAGTYDIAVRADYPEAGDRAAIARDPLVVLNPPPPPPPPPAPPPPPPPSPPSPPADAPAEITNGVGVTSKMKLITLRTAGVRVHYQCERACSIRGRLSLGPVSARRFGLGGGGASVAIGGAAARLPGPGTGKLTVKLTQRAKLALRNRDRVTLAVITDLTAGTVKLPGRYPVSVRR